MKNRGLILISFIWLIITSCIDLVDISMSEREGELVVYGMITNEIVTQSVKVYRSTSFRNTNDYPPVNDAEVYLLDRLDVRIDFLEDENTGVYLAPDDFNVIPGDAFELHVITDQGEHIVSTQEAVRPLPPIISINTIPILSPEEYTLDPLADNYYVSALIDDQVDINNYYRWRIYVNGELRSLASEIVLFDDKISDGVLFRYNAGNVLFKEGDIVSLKYYSLTAVAFDFFQLLKDQTAHNTLDASVIKPISIKSNMVNINDTEQLILGLFSTSEVGEVDNIKNRDPILK